MARLNVAPTKSNFLVLKNQLQFAREGYDLLEQKRQILIFELMSRLGRAREAERRITEALKPAFAALQRTMLSMGSDALDRAALAVKINHEVTIADQNVTGIRVPRVSVEAEPGGTQFGVGGTSAHADVAMGHFAGVLTLLAELAELENAVIRLARELRKTQRRCNALSRKFIPDCSETIHYITASMEERERESFIILKMIKHQLSMREGSREDSREEEASHA